MGNIFVFQLNIHIHIGIFNKYMQESWHGSWIRKLEKRRKSITWQNNARVIWLKHLRLANDLAYLSRKNKKLPYFDVLKQKKKAFAFHLPGFIIKC